MAVRYEGLPESGFAGGARGVARGKKRMKRKRLLQVNVQCQQDHITLLLELQKGGKDHEHHSKTAPLHPDLEDS